MSVIDTVSSVLDQYGVKDTATKESATMGKDAFLNLLVTQLKYQNPLEPTNDKEFLAQMAQFSSLEQMQNLNTSFQMSQASSLIDKYVQGTSINKISGEVSNIVGIVDAVNMKAGVPYLLVNKQELALSDVKSVVSDFGSETVAMIDAIKSLEAKMAAIEVLLGKKSITNTATDNVNATDATSTDTTDAMTTDATSGS